MELADNRQQIIVAMHYPFSHTFSVRGSQPIPQWVTEDNVLLTVLRLSLIIKRMRLYLHRKEICA